MSLIRRRRHHRIFSSHRFFTRFRRSTEAVYSPGNRLTLFRHGGEFFPALFDALEEAKHCICLEFYIIRDDGVGQRLAECLGRAARRGVAVYFIYDYIGSFETPTAFFRSLEKSGVRCVPFNPPPFRRGLTWFDKRDHRKIAVIDGEIAFTGGLNIAEEYAGFGESHKRWRDVGVLVEGPAAAELQTLFRLSWREETGAFPPGCGEEAAASLGEDSVLIVSGGPHHNRSLIRSAFRMAIAGGAKSITIATPYFVPGPRVIRSLLRAARRGVEVRLLLPSRSDVPLVRLVSRGYYAPLLKGGVEVFEREGTILHAKVMLIDDYWAVIGSANLDQRSFHRNYEVNVIVASHDFGGQVAEMLDDDIARSRRIVLEEHERRGLLVRFLERLCAPINWFL